MVRIAGPSVLISALISTVFMIFAPSERLLVAGNYRKRRKERQGGLNTRTYVKPEIYVMPFPSSTTSC